MFPALLDLGSTQWDGSGATIIANGFQSQLTILLFSNLIDNGMPVVTFVEQHCMLAAICCIVNSAFYDDKLITANNVDQIHDELVQALMIISNCQHFNIELPVIFAKFPAGCATQNKVMNHFQYNMYNICWVMSLIIMLVQHSVHLSDILVLVSHFIQANHYSQFPTLC